MSGAAAALPNAGSTDPRAWGADAIFTIENREDGVPGLLQAAGSANGRRRTASRTMARSIPVPGRDIMVQAWYQGGVSVFDWTDPKHPIEIAFFDRGPIDATPDGDGRQLVRVLVQRLHPQLRDRARPGYSRAQA